MKRYILGYDFPFVQVGKKNLYIQDHELIKYVMSYDTVIGWVDMKHKVFHATKCWHSQTTSKHINYVAKLYGLDIKRDFIQRTIK